jgi:anti-sigma factor RsiW
MSGHLTCETVLAQIGAYLDGELDAVGCGAIEEHCSDCASCATVVDGLQTTIGLCREAGRAPLPPAVRARAREQMKRLLAGGSLGPHEGRSPR